MMLANRVCVHWFSPRNHDASAVGERAIGHPDPGAEAVVVWLDALAEAEMGGAT